MTKTTNLLVVITATILSLNTYAKSTGSEKSWSEIFANKKIDVVTSYSLSGYKINDLCLNSSNQLQTKSAVNVCVEYSAPASCRPHQWPCESKCIRFENQSVVVNRNYSVESCARFVQPIKVHYPDCAETQVKEVRIPDVVNADVYQKIGSFGGESGSYFLFTKAFAFPSCQ